MAKANIIQIKRRGTTGAAGPASAMKSGEFFYNMADGYLYIGYGDDGAGNATTPKAVGHHDFNIARLLPSGGALGQVLKKNGPGNWDVTWGDGGTVYTPGNGLKLTGQEFSIDTGVVATVLAMNLALDGKANKAHQHAGEDITSGTIHVDRLPSIPAGKISGVLDPSQIPVMPSQKTIMAPGGIADLTTEQQGEIGQGTIVTTTDGRRWVYSGAGSKLAEASYIVLADVTPEWSVIQGKPVFSLVATSGSYADLDNLPQLGALAALNSISNANWSGTPLSVENGGTGATTQTGARAALGLAIGSNVQGFHQNLQALSALTGEADRGVYFTSGTGMATFVLTAFGRSLMGAADAPAARTGLGLGTMATQNASNVNITGGVFDNIVIDCGEV